MLKVQNLTKEFSEITAVDNISFELVPGKIYGLLGPNGAGKTTTIRMILNIIRPTAGEITFRGKKNDADFQNIVGYLPEERGLYKKSRVIDVLVYFAKLKGLNKTDSYDQSKKWLERFEIGHYACRKIEELSKGNQQKVQLITAIVHNPALLILDEPFSGFDPINQQLAKDMIFEFLDSGKLIVISTHMMEIAENLCSEIFVINKGREVLSGNIKEIKREFGGGTYRIKFSGDPAHLNNQLLARIVRIRENEAEIKLCESVQPPEFLRFISGKIDVFHFAASEPSLHEIFLDTISSRELQGDRK